MESQDKIKEKNEMERILDEIGGAFLNLLFGSSLLGILLKILDVLTIL